MRRLHCLGDSHAYVFEHVRERKMLQTTELIVTRVGGATAFGLANPNSATNALSVFRAALEAVPTTEPALFLVGEVDAGFLVWLRSQQRGTSVEAELAESLDRYARFVDEVRHTGREVIVATVPLPTVLDYSTWAGLANARREVRATLEERTAATRRYNEGLRRWAAARGVRLLDTEADLLDERTGLVRDVFRHPDPCNHHYETAAYASVVVPRLAELGFS